MPKNKQLPFYSLNKQYNPAGYQYLDAGLADNPLVNPQAERGKFKVPTLRNIAITAPYMHNGVFATLNEAIEFYNTRDTHKKWEKLKAGYEWDVNNSTLGAFITIENLLDEEYLLIADSGTGFETLGTPRVISLALEGSF